jgi:putative transposase
VASRLFGSGGFGSTFAGDEDDLKRCVDYVHCSPKKHGLVQRVADWPWSTFHRFVQQGEYDLDWGGSDPVPMFDMPDIA